MTFFKVWKLKIKHDRLDLLRTLASKWPMINLTKILKQLSNLREQNKLNEQAGQRNSVFTFDKYLYIKH